MRKIILLLIVISSFSGYAQNLVATPSTVTSGDVITITGTSESQAGGYFSSIARESTADQKTDGTPTSTYMYMSAPSEIRTFNVTTGAASTVKVTVTNNTSTPYTADFAFTVNITKFPGSTQTFVTKRVRLTVNPVPTVYYNDEMSQTFTKSCSPGYKAEPVTYKVEANKYTANTKLEANAKAKNEINANGQNAANAKPCLIEYKSIAISGSFVRNNCANNTEVGPPIPFTLAAGSSTSLISQADADSKAQSIFIFEGQKNANLNGLCTPVPYISGPSSGYRGQSYLFTANNTSSGDVLVWSVNSSAAGTIKSGQGTTFASVAFGNIAGAQAHSFIIRLKITSPTTGTVKTIEFNTTSLLCSNCPIN